MCVPSQRTPAAATARAAAGGEAGRSQKTARSLTESQCIELLLRLGLVGLDDAVDEREHHRQRRVALQVRLEEARDDRDHVHATEHVGKQHRHRRARRAEGTHDERQRVEEVVGEAATRARGKG